MSFPNLPTDNLYKFIALSGLVISLLSIIYFLESLNRLNNEIIKTGTEIGELEFNSNYLNIQKKNLEAEVEQLEIEVTKNYSINEKPEPINVKDLKERLKNKDYRSYLEFQFRYSKEIIPEEKSLQELNEKFKKLEEKTYDISLKTHQLKRKNEIIKGKLGQISNSKKIFKFRF